MNTLYDIITILPLSLISVILFGGYAGVPENSIAGYPLCIVFTVFVILLRNMTNRNRLRGIGIVSVFLAGLFIAAGEENRHLFAERYSWLVWIIVFSSAALIAGILTEKSIWLKRAVSAALFGFCVTGTLLKWKLGKAEFALICFILLVHLTEEIQRRWKKSGSPGMKGHVTRISPFFLALCMSVYLIPAPDKPYGWQFAKNIYSYTVSAFTRIYGYFSHTSDDYGNIGFSDRSGFLSGISENSDEVMNIRTDTGKIGEYKLVGCVSGEFRDCQWVFDTDSESFGRLTDSMETSTAVRKFASTSRADYIQKVEMDCETLYYNTRYMFCPSKVRYVPALLKKSGIREKNGSLISDSRMNFRDRYQVSCYVLNLANPGIEELLNTAAPISEEDWKQTAEAEDTADRSDYSFEAYQVYRKEINEQYCRSYGVSENVAEILDNIKNSSAGRYEAMKKLEYLLNSMEYSTDCGPLPDYVTDAGSFLDWFLFTSRKGWCTHYATAFVLMANEMGVPCRYVQGYCAAGDSSGNITVRESDAHAWPEVYFDNVGWVAFEPTPGYAVSAGWDVKIPSGYDPDRYKPDPAVESLQSGTPALPEEPGEERSGLSPLIFIIPAAAVISFLLLFYVISRTVSGKKYKHMSGSDKYRYLTKQNLRLLGYLDSGMNGGETLSEYLSRLMETDRQEIKEALSFIPVYEAVLYSDREITGEEISSAEEAYRSLRGLVKKKGLRARLKLFFSAAPQKEDKG